MRTPLDRLRHALSFEIVGLILVVPLATVLFHMPMEVIGVVGIVGATLATLWNYIYNYAFDLGLRRITGSTYKKGGTRILHAALFELGLLIVLLPFIAWYLGISVWQAFVMDVFFALFYMFYALVFNWVYDALFPLPEWKDAAP